ncbi:hypothetical protein Z517_11472 [Fonsecaea pedrosoi CBS 271.37]|uniref:Uncharacterized protein n=1 Tax=Fonsecaea pedrosoi CBS 271.37 TaxID=1442368 RepID=A0A0D2EJX7_9EURO|nr:uncharacterized protein Z517_11472 [Fonsecaea pedrosoi CBS 271.37]KIW74702.1 hypothetical protein Z517_11472 [Fonsecaea pedrosoi CBS 271.37]
MELTKKRSWTTALGGVDTCPDLVRPLDIDLWSTAQLNGPTDTKDHDDLEIQQETFSETCPKHQLAENCHVDLYESREHSLESSDESHRADPEILDETSSIPAIDSDTFSTSRSTEETEPLAKADEATTVCYGLITNSFAKLFPSSQRPSIEFLRKRTAFPIRIRSDGITICDTDAQEVAQLNQQHAAVIKKVKAQCPSLRCEVYLSLDDEIIRNVSKKQAHMVLSCEINLFGPASYGERVGTCLGNAHIFLQEPSVLHPSIPYSNPHVYSTTEEQLTPFFINQQSDDIHHFDQEIKTILCETHHGGLQSVFEQDSRIKTTLQPHQIEALDFMLRREATEEKHLLSTMYVHELTREKKYAPVNECVGGLLADEMGLGKSLSLLALIIHTLEEARHFMAYNHTASPRQVQKIGATLIVTPFSTLQNWQDELSKHLDAKALRLYVHHGQAKTRLHSDLATAQVVLTTYETISLGRKSSSGHLGQFSWFRIALDEAHWIRNSSTQVFQTLHEFEAERRWCLTGTPVQNGLGDLCALTRWLRFYPFDSTRSFRKLITDPLSRRDEAGLSNLRRMTRVFQIRRMKQALGLGGVTLRTISVSLSNLEHEQYDVVKTSILQTLAEASKVQKAQRSISTLLGIRDLRRICCDGISLQDRSARQLAEIPAWVSNVTCNQCGGTIRRAEWPSVFHGQCGHVLCKACRANSPNNSAEALAKEVSCLICGAVEEDLVFGNSPGVTSTYDGVTSLIPPEQDTGNFTPAKIVAVTSKLLELHQEPLAGTGKSLVFSYWLHALALLEKQLQRYGIECVRIDGKHSPDDRARALSAFRTDPEVRVMLVTFGTGSVGLTLTEATDVHLMEPHWNPMVEEQAIGRAHRIGQDKPVTVWRYVVEQSIEENIVRKQQRKLYLAKIAHSKHEGECSGGGRRNGRGQEDEEKLEDLLQECHLLRG